MPKSTKLNNPTLLTRNLAHYGAAIFAATFLSFVLFAQQVSAQDRCDAILANGTFDVVAGSSDTTVASSFVNWYSTALKKSSSSGGSAGFSYAGFGASGSQTSQQSMAQSASAFQSGDSTQSQRLAAFARTASQTIANAWTTCMTSMYGLKVSTRFTSDPNEFYVVFQFQPTNPERYPASKLKRLTPGSSVLTCDPIPRGGKSISAAQQPFRCRRSANQSVSVSYETADAVVNATNGPIVDFPAILPILPSTPQCGSVVRLTSGLSAGGRDRLFDGVKGPVGINSGREPSDFEISFASPQWVHHLLVYPIADPPGWTKTQFFGASSAGDWIPFDEQRRRVLTGIVYQVDFDTNKSRGLSKIRINTTDPRDWVAFSEIEVFVCQ